MTILSNEYILSLSLAILMILSYVLGNVRGRNHGKKQGEKQRREQANTIRGEIIDNIMEAFNASNNSLYVQLVDQINKLTSCTEEGIRETFEESLAKHTDTITAEIVHQSVSVKNQIIASEERHKMREAKRESRRKAQEAAVLAELKPAIEAEPEPAAEAESESEAV